MTAPLPLPEARILRPDQAAQYLGYEEATAAFRKYCDEIGIKPIRRGGYDKKAIDAAIDRASGLEAGTDYRTVKYG